MKTYESNKTDVLEFEYWAQIAVWEQEERVTCYWPPTQPSWDLPAPEMWPRSPTRVSLGRHDRTASPGQTPARSVDLAWVHDRRGSPWALLRTFCSWTDTSCRPASSRSDVAWLLAVQRRRLKTACSRTQRIYVQNSHHNHCALGLLPFNNCSFSYTMYEIVIIIIFNTTHQLASAHPRVKTQALNKWCRCINQSIKFINCWRDRCWIIKKADLTFAHFYTRTRAKQTKYKDKISILQ